MDPRIFEKTVSKKDGELEIELQQISSKYNFSPKIFIVTEYSNNLLITMENLGKNSLYEKYGDDPNNIPAWIWDSIRFMLRVLYQEEGIEYIDITPYNFIEAKGKIYVIDFGHAKYYDGTVNWFLDDFLKGHNGWNPDFN